MKLYTTTGERLYEIVQTGEGFEARIVRRRGLTRKLAIAFVNWIKKRNG